MASKKKEISDEMKKILFESWNIADQCSTPNYTLEETLQDVIRQGYLPKEAKIIEGKLILPNSACEKLLPSDPMIDNSQDAEND